MNLVTPISELIGRMGPSQSFTTDLSEQLHMGNLKKTEWSANKVQDIWQMLENSGWGIHFGYIVGMLSHLAFQGWYTIDSANNFTVLSATDRWWNSRYAHLSILQHCLHELLYHSISQQAKYMTETHVCGWYSSIKLTAIWDATEDFVISIIGQRFHIRIGDDLGHDICWLVFGYTHNVPLDHMFIGLFKRLLYYCQTFYGSTSVECLGLDCNVEYTNANQGIIYEYHNIWVQYMESDLDNNFHCHVLCFPMVYCSWPLPYQILEFRSAYPPQKWY